MAPSCASVPIAAHRSGAVKGRTLMAVISLFTNGCMNACACGLALMSQSFASMAIAHPAAFLSFLLFQLVKPHRANRPLCSSLGAAGVQPYSSERTCSGVKVGRILK